MEAYKSPLRKLVHVFKRSRDRWKAKCQERKRLCRKLANQVRAVEASREKWKQAAKEAQKQARQLEQQLNGLKSLPLTQ